VDLTWTRPWLIARALHRRARRAIGQLIDGALGVHTAWLEPTAAAAGDPAIATKPCAWLTLYRVFRWLDVSDADVLVDLGSGPGRAVLIGSLFPFRRVIGVERDPTLHRQAIANLAAFRLKRHADVELVCADVRDYTLPDDVTVIFLYNPFNGITFQETIAGVLRSLDRSPRRLRIVYVNPVEHEFLVATGRCRLVARLMSHLRPGRRWARTLAAYVYEVGPIPSSRS
jgi:hypothetical protein